MSSRVATLNVPASGTGTASLVNNFAARGRQLFLVSVSAKDVYAFEESPDSLAWFSTFPPVIASAGGQIVPLPESSAPYVRLNKLSGASTTGHAWVVGDDDAPATEPAMGIANLSGQTSIAGGGAQTSVLDIVADQGDGSYVFVGYLQGTDNSVTPNDWSVQIVAMWRRVAGVVTAVGSGSPAVPAGTVTGTLSAAAPVVPGVSSNAAGIDWMVIPHASATGQTMSLLAQPGALRDVNWRIWGALQYTPWAT